MIVGAGFTLPSTLIEIERNIKMRFVKVFLMAVVFMLYVFPVFAELPPVDTKYGNKVDITFNSSIDIIPGGKTCPVISPDGKYVAFLNNFHDENYSLHTGIFMVPAEGGEVSIVYDSIIQIDFLQFIPNVKELCFTEVTSLNQYDQIFTLKAVNIETKKVREVLGNAMYSQFSYDGRYISFINCDHAGHYLIPSIYDTVTGGKRYLINANLSFDNGLYTSPAISQDLKWVYFNKYTNREPVTGYWQGQLFRIPFEGGQEEQVSFFNNVSGPTKCQYLNFSPDGKCLLFDYEFQVLVYNLENKKFYDAFSGNIVEKPLGQPIDTGIETSPNLMPDGTSFVFNVRMGGRELKNDLLNNNVPEAMEKDLFGSAIYTCMFSAAKYAGGGQLAVESENPAEFALLKNYPNPFNPTTTIEFTVTKPGQVNLSVYSITGQKVCELVSGSVTAGKHSVVWNGRDSKDTLMSSGIYISYLETKDYIISQRMMLVK
jgi:Tol biopolymer transport system component